MIREDRELLAELARVNSDVAPLAMQIMEGSATAEGQRALARRLVCLGQRLRERAEQAGGVIEGQVIDETAHAACCDLAAKGSES